MAKRHAVYFASWWNAMLVWWQEIGLAAARAAPQSSKNPFNIRAGQPQVSFHGAPAAEVGRLARRLQ
jgi:hypothetical protein